MKIGWIYLLFSFSLYAHSIIFIHLGDTLPNHLPAAIAQARLFNKECPIYLIANGSALRKGSSPLQPYNVTFISSESLPRSPAHNRFLRSSKLDKRSANGYWLYTTERFFYLDECITAKQLSDVIHLENDIMVYANFDQFLPIFKKDYSGMIGATFENDGRCCAGLLYIANYEPMNRLIEHFADQAHFSEVDMHMIGSFKQLYKKRWIDYLPTIPPEYIFHSPSLHSTEPESYSNHFEEFASVFDAAALGIYLGGIDPHFHVESGPGKDWPHSLMAPSDFEFLWEADSENRLIPYMIYQGRKIPINNLHITSKKLNLFSSLRQENAL